MDRNDTPRKSAMGAIIALLVALALGAGCAARRAPAAGPGAHFRYHGQSASVCVAGDFNGWSRDRDCLADVSGEWVLDLPLAPGRYRYGLCRDGGAPEPDPEAALAEDDGFGGRNSVLIVR